MKNITKVPIYFFVLLVMCINFIPLVSASPFLEYYSGSVDDDNSGSSSGNSNGKINPEEIIEITVKIKNNGNTDVSGVIGQLRLKRSNPHVTIIDDDASYGTIGLNERKEGTFIFHVSDVQENSIYESISFEIILTDSSGNTWTDSFTKYVDFPSITVTPTETPTSEPTDVDTSDLDAFNPTVTEISDSEDTETYNFPPSKYSIDGYSNDWSGIEPIVTDEKGDGVNGVTGTDIKAIYTDSDSNYLYLMMELWDGPTNPQINDYFINENHYGGFYSLQLITDDDEDKDIYDRGPHISFHPDIDRSLALSTPSHIYEIYDMVIVNYEDNEMDHIYDSTGYFIDINNHQNVLYACKDVVEIQIPWDVIENPNIFQIRGAVNVAHAMNAGDDGSDYFRDHTESDEYIPTSFKITDFKDLSSFIIKLQNAQDPLSRYIRDQFSEDTLRLLDEYNGQGAPSEALQKALVDELNRILQSDSLYDQQRFENIELSEDVLKLIEDNPQGKDLIELNRRLLEEAYPQEIEKSEYKVKESKRIPGFMGFSLIISILFIWLVRK